MRGGLKRLCLTVGLSGVGLLGRLDLRGQSDSQSSPAAGKNSRPPDIQVQWISESAVPGEVILQVSGLSRSFLSELSKEDPNPALWQTWLSVFTDMGSVAANMDLPPMMGEYQVGDQTNLLFKPEFPLQPGMTYRAVVRVPSIQTGLVVLDRNQLLSFTYRLPDEQGGVATRVVQIHPGVSVLPENLLKFYIEFSGPMSRGRVYDHIQLSNEQGKVVDLPFLELDEELWNPSMTRLTLFIDPGRIKRGVKPLEDIGPALEEGGRYTLKVSRAWRDALNAPLEQDFHKEFQVGPPDRESPDPHDWILEAPAANTRAALIVWFPEPLDHALAARMIHVADAMGRSLPGQVELGEHDKRWRFIPARSWEKGSYQLAVQKIIEDLAGNNIGKPFEVESSSPVPKDYASGMVRLDFQIR